MAAKRNVMFMVLLLCTSTIIGGGWVISGLLHWSRISTYALIGGFGLLPFMVTLLILVILGNDSVHLAKQGKLPAWVVQRYPYPEPRSSTA
jgi:heme A synthase